MDRNSEGQMICKHCNEPITLRAPGETWVNADTGAYHRKCYDKAMAPVIEATQRAATLRAVYDRAFDAALLATVPFYIREGRLQAARIDAHAVALESVRTHAARMVELERVIAEGAE